MGVLFRLQRRNRGPHVEVTFPRFSQKVSGRARAEASPDPELGGWAEWYCSNILRGSRMLVVGRAQSFPR